ncbi:tetratricopeptide repeat protein [Flavobacterium silvaticum]|uniref:Tetratricopeptide repeat protein n=1 Tax=Flavobacterium silvaticum TaxID=1852020 RepID=A0A972JHW6_9FLAO|nr:tetratricopeptide repeat protein [Flavobacterium silvaticum]NMH27568.1 hypothetical protein [Flavobacterium silvaticum]
MNLSEYTYLLNHPDAVTAHDTEELDKIVTEFPYFQSARALRLKGLYKEDSFRYNYALKVTAAYTSDRGVLFDFITSNQFHSVTRTIFEDKQQELLDLPVTENISEEVKPDEIIEEPTIEAANVEVEEETITFLSDPATLSILDSIREATVDYTVVESEPEIETATEEPADIPESKEIIETPEAAAVSVPQIAADEKLGIGKPLDFSQDEKHSFQEWLQLSAFHPIQRENPQPDSEEETAQNTDGDLNEERQKKNELIDRFIENNPKIPPVKKDLPLPALSVEPSRAVDNSYLMTETLARVYLEQKKYDKAIQAYEILILKYPEKSSFFADRILDIRTLKNINS